MPGLDEYTLTLRGSGRTYDEYDELQKKFETGRSLVCRRTTPDIDEQANVVLKLAPDFKMYSAQHVAIRITVSYGDRLVVHDQILDQRQIQTARTRGIQLAGLVSLPTPLATGQKVRHPSQSWTWREGIICASIKRGSADPDETVQGMSAKTWEAKVTKTQRTPPEEWYSYCQGWTPIATERESRVLSFEIRPSGYANDKSLLTRVEYLPSSAADLLSLPTRRSNAPRIVRMRIVTAYLMVGNQATKLHLCPALEPPRIHGSSSAKASSRSAAREKPRPSVCSNEDQNAWGLDEDRDDEEVKPLIASSNQLSQAAARVVLLSAKESEHRFSLDEPIRTVSSAEKRKRSSTSDEEEDMDELDDQLREVELEEKKIKIKRKMQKLKKKAA
ncbi:hypothetical protein LTR27_008331 [Elasticomyces elasticus]|nr:hypothetical protein LTR27_008331 [Elasticomyces elasticus]